MNYIKLALSLICTMYLLVGCKSYIPSGSISNETKHSDTIFHSVDNTEEPIIGSEIPEWAKESIQIGTFENIIRLGGSYRDRVDVIENDTLIFPEGKVVTFIAHNQTNAFKVDYTRDEMKEFIALLEESSIESDVHLESKELMGIILLLNTSAKYLDIKIYRYTSEIYKLYIGYEKEDVLLKYDEDKSYEVYLRSAKVINIMKIILGSE
jgi:hypothetical protein